MQQSNEQFDDPALKQAIRRAMSATEPSGAPPALRNRIEAMLRQEQALQDARLSHWRRPMMSMLAAAAVLAIGLGVAYYLLGRDEKAPQFFADAMVVAHDRCAGMTDHHLLQGIASDADLATIRQALHSKVGHPVLVTELGDGWKFAGAGVCEISNVPAAHMLFTRGDETVSIFSVSAGAFYMNSDSSGSSEGKTYAQIDQNHEISGFVQGGAIHCLVGYSKSGKLSLSEITKLRERIRNQVAMGEIELASAGCSHLGAAR